jgi:large conductance mechanosensitive channel
LLIQPALRAANAEDIAPLQIGGIFYGKVLSAGIDFIIVASIVFLIAKYVLREEVVTKK